MENIRVSIASPPDRARLVAELFLDDIQIAEISKEDDAKLIVEIYPRPDGEPWRLQLAPLLEAVVKAKHRLGAE